MKRFLPIVLALLGCGGSKNTPTVVSQSSIDWEETTKIEYRFGASSVAPDYHRSYVIIITDSTKSIAIDSYGTILLTKEYSNTPSEFLAFKDKLSKTGIKKRKEKENRPCDGGTTETLRLYKGDIKYFDAYVYYCSGESGTLFLPNEAADLIRSQIPESVTSLIESTMPKN